LYFFVIEGAVFFVLPIPNYNIYPLVFNEGYLLDMMAVQLGGLVLSFFNGLNRIRNLSNPGNRALGLFAESAGLYRAKDFIWGILEVPYNYVTDEIVSRLSSKLSGLMPDSVSSLGSSVVSGVSSVGSTVVSGASSVGSTVASGASSLVSGASSLVSGAGAAKNYLTSYWTGTGGSISPKLIATQEYELTEKSFNLLDFEEFDKISLLTPAQQKEFNKSPMGKNLNRLKTIMDNVFIKNMEHILKFETLRVSEFMVYVGHILDNIVDNGMPYFRQSFSNHVEVYKELKKYNLKVINTKQFFPELLNIDIETFLHPRRNIRMKTLKRK
jgi:X-X-X-Leu-X-X-Gly heptad repeat protein